jgi:primosomal protein N'
MKEGYAARRPRAHGEKALAQVDLSHERCRGRRDRNDFQALRGDRVASGREQVLILLNRRGYATQLSAVSVDAQCTQCSVALTFTDRDAAVCHRTRSADTGAL